MFNFFKSNNYLITSNHFDRYLVRNKKELRRAVKSKQRIIVAKGDLARQIQKAGKIKQISPFGKAAIGTFLATTPLSFANPIVAIAHKFAIMPLAVTVGIETVYLVAILFLGITLVTAIYSNYTLEFSIKRGEFYVKMEAK